MLHTFGLFDDETSVHQREPSEDNRSRPSTTETCETFGQQNVTANNNNNNVRVRDLKIGHHASVQEQQPQRASFPGIPRQDEVHVQGLPKAQISANSGGIPIWRTLRNDPRTRYFLLKSFSNESIELAVRHSVWATGGLNERHFNDIFMNNTPIVFFFSVNNSGRFCGYASMQSRPGASVVKRNVFFTPRGKPFPGRQFDIQWLRTTELSFREIEHVCNSLNEMKSVKVGRDGQEIAWEAGGVVLDTWEYRAKLNNQAPALMTDDNIPVIPSYNIPSVQQPSPYSELKKRKLHQPSIRQETHHQQPQQQHHHQQHQQQQMATTKPISPSNTTASGDRPLLRYDEQMTPPSVPPSLTPNETVPNFQNRIRVPNHQSDSYTPGRIQTCDVPEGPDFPSISYDDILCMNPLLALYPVDLTKMDYSLYEQLYNESIEELAKTKEVFRPSISQFWDFKDWTETAKQMLNVDSTEALIGSLLSNTTTMNQI